MHIISPKGLDLLLGLKEAEFGSSQLPSCFDQLGEKVARTVKVVPLYRACPIKLSGVIQEVH